MYMYNTVYVTLMRADCQPSTFPVALPVFVVCHFVSIASSSMLNIIFANVVPRMRDIHLLPFPGDARCKQI